MAEAFARSAEAAPETLALLYTIARRRIVDEARRQSRSDDLPLDGAPEPHRDGDYGQLVACALANALDGLRGALTSVRRVLPSEPA